MLRKILVLSVLLPQIVFSAELVKDGKPAAVLILPEKPSASVQFAAEELKSHIQKMTGAVLPIAAEPQNGMTAIYLGKDAAKYRDQEYSVSVKGNEIVLSGEDAEDFRKVDYSNPKTWPDPWKGTGTLNAAYDFLNLLGVRWYLPTELGCTFTPCKDLSVKDVSYSRKPSLESRKIFTHVLPAYPKELYADSVPSKTPVPTMDERDVLLYYYRQRMGGKQIVVNHSMGAFNKRFGKTHPDWFAHGRMFRWDSQLCYTNPEVIAQAVKDARDYFDGKTDARTVMEGHYTVTQYSDPVRDVYAMVPMDNGAFCLCDKCQALTDQFAKASDETSNGKRISNLFFSFVNAVAKEVKKTHPDKTIAVLSYADYAWPPTQFKLEDNIMVEFCLTVRSIQIPSEIQDNFNRLREWHRQYPKMKKYVWLYYCWPVITTRNSKGRVFPGYFAEHVQEYWKVFKEVGIQGYFIELSGANGVRFPMFDLPDFEIHSRLAWDSSLSAEELFNEFFEKFYGPAAKPMKELYQTAENIYCNPANYPKGTGVWSTYPMSRFVTPEVSRKFESLLKQAESLAKTDPYMSRVKLFRNAIWEYIKKELDEEGKRLFSMQQQRVPLCQVPVPGEPEKVDWSKAANLLLYDGLRANGLSGKPISVKVLHDGTWIYFNYTEYIKAEDLRKRDGVWRDDTWESFFAKQRGVPYSLLGACINGQHEFLACGDGYQKTQFPGTVMVKELGKNGWQVLIAAKLAEIVPGGIQPGEILYYNVLRSRDAKCSACYVPTWGQFHVPERFGELYLQK